MDAGLFIEPQFGFPYDVIRELALDAEAMGFSHLWVSDHFFFRADEAQTHCLEAWTLLAALSQVTARLRLGTLVTAQSYRNPALLAKLAADVDVMSGGRLEFGIGAGWKEVEYRAYGIPFPPAGVRVSQLIDTLEIVRALWTQERASYHGRHYAIDGAPCAPKPLQQPHPPITIGVLQPRMMRVAARYADAVNFRDFFAPPERYAALLDQLRAACAQEGRPFNRLRCTHTTYTVIARTRRDVDALLPEVMRRWGPNAEQRLRGATVGTPAEVRERLEAYRALGVSQVVFLFPYGKERAMMRLVAEDVLPRLP
jgi:F420-dependent oxidoreductase-like protein